MKATKGNNTSGNQQDLESVSKQFERWRAQKQEGERIPQHLWQAATSLYPQYSMYKISRSLRLDSGDLRDRIHRGGGKNRRPKSNEVTQFMPLSVAPAEGLADCHIKVKDGRKTRLTIRLKGAGVQSLVDLLREIWGRGA